MGKTWLVNASHRKNGRITFMNNFGEKLHKFLTPNFVPEDSLNAFILKKAMEMEEIG